MVRQMTVGAKTLAVTGSDGLPRGIALRVNKRLMHMPTVSNQWSDGRLGFLRCGIVNQGHPDDWGRGTMGHSVMFHNTLEIILTNPKCSQHYGTQHNNFDS